jgi:hypothetical protein
MHRTCYSFIKLAAAVSQVSVPLCAGPPQKREIAMNILTLFAPFVVGGLVVYVFKPFLGSYSAKKGENLATKEDIAQLTKITEGIKAQISDEVWDRQRQWEMKRDAVSDALRTLRELETSLISLHSVFSHPMVENALRIQSAAQFDACNTKYLHAKDFADLVVGKELPKHLAAYFQQVGAIAQEVLKGNPAYFTSERKSKLAEKYNKIAQEARKELNIQEH